VRLIAFYDSFNFTHMPLATIVQFCGKAHETSMLQYPDGDGPAITRAQRALEDLMQMSSPLQNYKITDATSSPSKEAKGTIGTLQSKFDLLEKRFNDFQDAVDKGWQEEDKRWQNKDQRWQEEDQRWQEEDQRRQEEKEVVWRWETSERVAQGFNDYLVEKIKADGRKMLETWNGSGQLRYLPHLFTVLLCKQCVIDGRGSPPVPIIRSLPNARFDSYISIDIPDSVCEAAKALWDSGYEPLIKLMVTSYLSKKAERNVMQHPSPTTIFAETYAKSLPNLSLRSIRVISHVIKAGTKGVEREFLFQRSTPEGSEVADLGSLLDMELDEGLNDEDLFIRSTPDNGEGLEVGGKRKTRDMELVQDDTYTVPEKKSKHN